MNILKIILSTFLIMILNVSFSQTTAIPDVNFESALILLGLDDVVDGKVLTSNISEITQLDVSWRNIHDLSGIEDFISLTHLNCDYNSLTSIDITQNTALTFLNCAENDDLTSLNVTQNTALTILYVGAVQITSLDLAQNTALTKLVCCETDITQLDISQNTALTYLNCQDNHLLNCLNVKNGNNINFTHFDARENPNLTCIEVDNDVWSTTNWTNIEAQSYFSTDCNNSCSVGISDYKLANLSIYPNPTTGIINIELGETISNLTVSIINCFGQVLISKEYESTDFINFNINIPPGIYFLTLKAIDREAITLKLYKQ